MYLIIMQMVIRCKSVPMWESSGSIRFLCVCCSPDTTPKWSAKKNQWLCQKQLLQMYCQSNKGTESEVTLPVAL